MKRLLSFGYRRPRAALSLWLAACAALALFGAGAGGRVQQADLNVRGSESGRALQLSSSHFGNDSSLPILLSGPSRDVRHQGRALAARLEREHGVTVLSPWSAGARAASLRPAANQLVLVASVSGSKQYVADEAQRIDRLARASVSGPVVARVTGVALVAHDLADANHRAVRRAETIALPILLLVLLLVFRSALAAAIPVAFGAATIFAGNGLVDLIAKALPIDSFATALASMMGLALAVDYSLLMVARFREERAKSGHEEAVVAASHSAGHVVAAAGAAIAAAMLLAAAVSPARPVLSATLGVAAVALLSVAGASLAIPAMLMLAGDRIQPRSLGRASAGGRGVWDIVGPLAMRRPALALVLPAIALGALAIPALSLHTGTPDVRELPASASARKDYEAMNKVIAPGWGAGFEIVANAHRGAMTTPSRLKAMAKLQSALAKDEDVAAVFGPGSIERSARELRQAGHRLLDERNSAPAQKRGLTRLDSSVSNASSGVTSLDSALGKAAHMASTVSAGSAAAAGGVDKLRAGVSQLGSGAHSLQGKLQSAGAGQRALADGAKNAHSTASGVAHELVSLADAIAKIPDASKSAAQSIRGQGANLDGAVSTLRSRNQDIDNNLKNAQAALASGKATVATLAAAAAISKARAALAANDIAGSLTTTSQQLSKYADTTQQLGSAADIGGIQKIAHQAGALASGLGLLDGKIRELGGIVSKLGGGAGSLVAAVNRVSGGTQALGAGIAQLRRGSTGLAGGVETGRARTAALAAGLHGAQTAVHGMRGSAAGADTAAGEKPDPKVLDSGYFVLATLDGQGADSGVDVATGGQAARILVVPRGDASDPRTAALYRRLQVAARDFGAANGAAVAVGGPAAQLVDYQHAVSSRFSRIILLLVLATALLLGILLRSVLVPLIGVVLNLLCVGATLGILSLLFVGSHPVMGGSGHLDATTITVIFAVMFALSTDYQVFIVSRIREEFLRSGDAYEAIDSGMRSTARVVTGAAFSTVAVFASFASTDVASLRAFGVGLAVSVVIDATVIRLILLPAALRLAGNRAWLRTPNAHPIEAPSVGVTVPA
jgi:RND superfamily putative drug exporter